MGMAIGLAIWRHQFLGGLSPGNSPILSSASLCLSWVTEAGLVKVAESCERLGLHTCRHSFQIPLPPAGLWLLEARYWK